MASQRILSQKFIQALQDSGVIREGELIRRLVIDAKAGEPVVIYIERYGDERLLDVSASLKGMEVRGVPGS